MTEQEQILWEVVELQRKQTAIMRGMFEVAALQAKAVVASSSNDIGTKSKQQDALNTIAKDVDRIVG